MLRNTSKLRRKTRRPFLGVPRWLPRLAARRKLTEAGPWRKVECPRVVKQCYMKLTKGGVTQRPLGPSRADNNPTPNALLDSRTTTLEPCLLLHISSLTPLFRVPPTTAPCIAAEPQQLRDCCPHRDQHPDRRSSVRYAVQVAAITFCSVYGPRRLSSSAFPFQFQSVERRISI